MLFMTHEHETHLSKMLYLLNGNRDYIQSNSRLSKSIVVLVIKKKKSIVVLVIKKKSIVVTSIYNIFCFFRVHILLNLKKVNIGNMVKTEQRRKIKLGNTMKTEHRRKKERLKGITRVKEKGRIK